MAAARCRQHNHTAVNPYFEKKKKSRDINLNLHKARGWTHIDRISHRISHLKRAPSDNGSQSSGSVKGDTAEKEGADW